MKLNGVGVTVSTMHIDQVDDSFIMHDPATDKVMVLNRTASLIWEMISEYWKRNLDIATADLATKIAEVCEVDDLENAVVYNDVDEVLTDFFRAGLLRAS